MGALNDLTPASDDTVYLSRRARREAEEAAAPTSTRRQARAAERPPRAPRQRPERQRPTRRPAESAARAPRSPRRILAKVVSISAMVGVFALLVSTSVPASAFYTPAQLVALAENGDAPSTAAALSAAVAPERVDETQKVVVNAQAAEAGAESAVVERDAYEAKAFSQQITNYSGNPNLTYTNNPYGTVQWPFVGTVPISSGFGPRSVCAYCSTYHLGIDFTPGSGVPIQAIAAGTVSAVRLDSGGLGNHVIIDHVINGQRVQSLYAHMQWGSIQVAVGQQVDVGTIVGLVGSTGVSTGAHLHFEIHLDGTPVDPYAWLKANAN